MKYREMIKRVQVKSGFSDAESKDAIQHMVESLAAHLTEGERKDFSSQLPSELQDIALSIRATEDNARQDFIEQFMQNQDIDEKRAKKQILVAWETLKEAISEGQINHIRTQLSKDQASLLH